MATDGLRRLSSTSERIRQEELGRNRLIRQLRASKVPLTQLAAASSLSLGTVHKLTRPATVVSVGYEGRSAGELVLELQAHHLAVLVDVRANAISRKPGLSRRALEQLCAEHGIRYVHEPSLGNPRDNRDGFRSREPASVERYRQVLLSEGREALDRVARLVATQTVGLLCFEADPCDCHRSVIVEHLANEDPLLQVVQA